MNPSELPNPDGTSRCMITRQTQASSEPPKGGDNLIANSISITVYRLGITPVKHNRRDPLK